MIKKKKTSEIKEYTAEHFNAYEPIKSVTELISIQRNTTANYI